MKKTLLILLALSIFCFAGCRESDNTQSTQNSVATNAGLLTGEVHEYNSEGQIVKTTVYDATGRLQYIETTDYMENGTCKTVFNADGVEIHREMNYGEAYNGGVQHTHQISENGEVTFLSITDTSDNGTTVMISEAVRGTVKTRAVTALDEEGNDYYGLLEVIDNGVLTEYSCWRNYRESDVISRQINYIPNTDTYELVEEIIDPSTGKNVPKTTLIPADEYEQFDWEILK